MENFLRDIQLPHAASHKGQNGKVMIIGGSELFHAASQWALTVVSKMVDMVFYASIPSNNEIVQHNKQHFSNGIVIPREHIEDYILESDVILIGPGMERLFLHNLTPVQSIHEKPTADEWDNDTSKITNYLLSQYPDKKWVVDAGALQMVDPKLLNDNCIITPHQREFKWLMKKVDPNFHFDINHPEKFTTELFNNCTVLLKGPTDLVYSPTSYNLPPTSIAGGNEGMTKGGTGDVLAGIVAGLYCFTNNPVAAAVVASTINKQAGDALYAKVGPFFNASDLAEQIPETMAKVFGYTDSSI